MRSHFFRFGAFWLFQLVWVWTVSLPVTILNSPNSSWPPNGGGNPSFGSATDAAGVIFWSIGFTLEALADTQKYLFKSRKPY